MERTETRVRPATTSANDAETGATGGEFRTAGYSALVALALLNIADVLITQAVLRRGGIELNPLVQQLISSNKALIVKLSIVVLLAVDFVLRRPRLITLCALWFVVGVYAFVVVVNGIELSAVRQVALS